MGNPGTMTVHSMNGKSTEDPCERFRSLHLRGRPLLLPNAWDVASARAVEATGFPAVATTSGGVAATLGYEDHEGAPGAEMLEAAARIAAGVSVPVTVDAEAGYAMDPAELAGALKEMGAAGVNLEDSDHVAGALRDPGRQATWLRAVRKAADDLGHALVINARIDVFLAADPTRSGEVDQSEQVGKALRRAETYAEAGADCVYPIALWQRAALEQFVSSFEGPVNVLSIPSAPSIAELAEIGVARVSWGGRLQAASIENLRATLESIASEPGTGGS
jgi:2-methylisocitrate lyase-like PEP mutase family enzyme